MNNIEALERLADCSVRVTETFEEAEMGYRDAVQDLEVKRQLEVEVSDLFTDE